MLLGNRFNFVTDLYVNLSKFPKNNRPMCQRQCLKKKKNLPRKRKPSVSMEYINFSRDNVYGKISSMIGLVMAFLTIGNIPFIEPMFKKQVQSSKFSTKNFSQKISHIPVFVITNAAGSPYLTNSSKGEQVGLIFFSCFDAERYLYKMQKTHNLVDAEIQIIRLDKAYKIATTYVTEVIGKGLQGERAPMNFKFYPDQQQMRSARSLTKKKNFLESFKGCPVFVAEGLTIKKGKEDIVPIFLTKEDLDSAWRSVYWNNPALKNTVPNIEVYDLFQIIKEMQENNPEFNNYGFFPPSASVFLVEARKIAQSGFNAKIPSGLIKKF
mmetsp:Transcript_47692/g.113238  ORF Transcript_47692/g.113238 Transcript_47692/m.113238 type:complete len:324 (+) Transcript_47692:13-984(+)